jgi:hypothetical protein
MCKNEGGRRMRELNLGESHPCKCHEKHSVLSNEDYEHVKRCYYEATQYFFCRNCDAEWRIVTWCVGQHDRIIIDREPFEEEEE